MTNTPYQRAVAEVKKLLKSQKISYATFAAELGLSVSGLKKTLAATDGSLGRLSQMAQALGISLGKLLNSSEESLTPINFSREQTGAFARDRELFPFYWSLVYERLPVDTIAAERKFTKTRISEILRKLHQIKLIRLKANQNIRIPEITPVAWTNDSEFVARLYTEWSKAIALNTIQLRGKHDSQFILRYFQMTKKTYQEFLMAQRMMESEFLKRSVQEMRSSRESLGHVRWLACTDQARFFW